MRRPQRSGSCSMWKWPMRHPSSSSFLISSYHSPSRHGVGAVVLSPSRNHPSGGSTNHPATRCRHTHQCPPRSLRFAPHKLRRLSLPSRSSDRSTSPGSTPLDQHLGLRVPKTKTERSSNKSPQRAPHLFLLHPLPLLLLRLRTTMTLDPPLKGAVI